MSRTHPKPKFPRRPIPPPTRPHKVKKGAKPKHKKQDQEEHFSWQKDGAVW